MGEGKEGRRGTAVLFCYSGRYPEPKLGDVWALNNFVPFQVLSGPLHPRQTNGVKHMAQGVPGLVHMGSHCFLIRLGFQEGP